MSGLGACLAAAAGLSAAGFAAVGFAAVGAGVVSAAGGVSSSVRGALVAL